jgi:tetratricopeptide (TPR) repeat protein
MRLNSPSSWVLPVLVLGMAASSGCDKTNTAGSSAVSTGGSQIPITTKSEDARKEFLMGREFAEKLQAPESVQHFDNAIALDPDFASAELARANAAATTKEFFDHLGKAVGLADKTSEGERLIIVATQAGANGEVVKQKDNLEKLVAAFPNDERAHFNLGAFEFGQQDYPVAIDHLKKAIELSPNFSPAYNMLGYAYRQVSDYSDAEQAFKKYIELIPADPNPYDSYAELLLKVGKFGDSVEQYRKGLTIDPHFAPSRFGVAADLLYMGKPEDANAELQKMAAQARNDGELRTALFGMAVVASDGSKWDKAVEAMDKEYAVAEKKNDVASMAADLQAKGNIIAEIPKYDLATRQFERSFQIVESSSLSPEIKDNAKLLHHYNMAALAIAKKDYAAAKSHAAEYHQGAEASKNPAQVKLAHELTGRIALAQKDYDAAISELQQANQQDPRNLYRLAQAYQAKGDQEKAKQLYAQAATFNSLPALPYAFVRIKAKKMAPATKG